MVIHEDSTVKPPRKDYPFKIRVSKHLSVLFTMIEDHLKLSHEEYKWRYTYNERKLKGHETPMSLGLVDDSKIYLKINEVLDESPSNNSKQVTFLLKKDSVRIENKV